MAETIPSGNLSAKAMLSLVLGLTGLPALLLGYLALREINLSDGRIQGRRLAVAGMILGGVGTVVHLLGLVAIILVNIREKASRATCAHNLHQIGLAANLY